jgi:hypothetical protein
MDRLNKLKDYIHEEENKGVSANIIQVLMKQIENQKKIADEELSRESDIEMLHQSYMAKLAANLKKREEQQQLKREEEQQLKREEEQQLKNNVLREQQQKN